MESYDSLAEALTVATNHLLDTGEQVTGVTDPLSVGSSHGRKPRPFREIIGYSFRLSNPQANLVERRTRPINIQYLISNILWTVSSSDLVDEIERWNPRAALFSDDGVCIRSAIGPRIFGARNQFMLAADKIKADPSTRRSILILIEPVDLQAHTRDVPCISTLHFFLRGGQLHAVGVMRSQSSLMVMPYDIPLLTSIQALMAYAVGAEIGTYTHFSDSFHIYEDELPIAAEVARGNVQSYVMPDICSLDKLIDLAGIAKSLTGLAEDTLLNLRLDTYDCGSDFFDSALRVLWGAAVAKIGHRELAQHAWSQAGALGRLANLR